MPPWPTIDCVTPSGWRSGSGPDATEYLRSTFEPPKTKNTRTAMARLKKKLERNSDVGANGNPAFSTIWLVMPP